MFFAACLVLIAIAMIAWRYRQMLTLTHGVMAVMIVGSVLGHPFYHASVAGFPITLDRLLLAGLMAYTAFAIHTGRLCWAPWNRVDALLLTFVGLLTINVLTSDWRYRDNQPLAQLLFNYFVPLGLYLVVRNLPGNRQQFRIITFGLMGLAAYLALIAVCEVKGWYGLIFPKFIINAEETEFLGRGRGPFLNPVACGLYQLLGLCSGMVWWTKANHPQKAGLVAFAVVVLTGLFCTLTRSVWLATAVVLALYVWLNVDWKWRGLFLAAAPVTLAGFLLVAGDRLNSFKRDKEVSVEEMSESIQLRPLLAVVATRMIADRPLLGHGLRQYSKYRAQFTTRDHSDQPLQKVLPYVQHNLFLSYAVDIGLIGLMSYLVLYLTWTIQGFRLWRDTRLPWDVRQSGYLLLAFLIGFAINGLFHDTSVIVMQHHLMFLLAAWVSAQYRYFLTPVVPPVEQPSTVHPTNDSPAIGRWNRWPLGNS